MNLSTLWLSQYIDIKSLSIEDLATKLTMAGLEVEAIHKTVNIPYGVVIAQILKREKHPNADKLSVCEVTDGSQTYQIVCGAPNCDAGKKIPLATLGTTFVDANGSEFKIKEAKLRGVPSFGMMCSAKELGISTEGHGLLELADSAILGTPVSSMFPSDTVFELEVTPNRPDWLSHWGVARDLAALIHIPPKFPDILLPDAPTEKPAEIIDNQAPELCPRYTLRMIKGVTVKESPDWLKQRLTAIGLRPINNIVDITNFVLHELGQPLHAFDLNQLSGQKIIVRPARPGEKFTTLDEKTISLNPHNLVIADAEKAVALAGVMGGLNSGVTEQTTDILIESATFFPSNIRATSREFNISSDSSYRFERGVDFNMVETASNRCAQLVLELAGGTLATPLIDIQNGKATQAIFKINPHRINKLLGTQIETATILEIIKNLGITILNVEENYYTVQSPSFRQDLYREADIAEEIARINGLDKIPIPQLKAVKCGTNKDDALHPIQEIRDRLVALGLMECYSYSMVDEKTADDPTFTKDEIIKISNPLNLDMAYMRPTLFKPMLQNVAYNIARNNHNLKLFELGCVFCKNSPRFKEERKEVIVAMTGLKYPNQYSKERTIEYDFYDLKGILESFFMSRYQQCEMIATTDPRFMSGHCAEIKVNGKIVGVMGEVASVYTKSMRLRYPLFMAILQFSQIVLKEINPQKLEQITAFPGTTRDIALVADESLQHQEIVDFIYNLRPKFLESVSIFDIFRDEKNIGDNKKSMAYSLTFRNSEKTLTDDEVNSICENIRSHLASQLHVELR